MAEDYIKREDAIKAMENRFADIMRTHKRRVTIGEKAIANDMIETAKAVKSADVVPVVRCKGCKWCEGYGYAYVCHNPRYGDGYANYQPPHINDEYWCADGERKDEEADK